MKLYLVCESDRIEEAVPRVWQTGIVISVPSFVPLYMLLQARAAAVQRPSRQHGEARWSLCHLVIKELWGLLLGRQLLCHHMTRTWPNTLFPFLTVLLRQ